jgi:uncharacterized protein YbjT (DUF2867 family)
MIFVTGATGTVGQETVKALKAKGIRLKVGSRDPKKAEAQLGVTAVAWDWEKPETFAAALSGSETLFLLTPPGTTKELAYAGSAIEAAKKAGLKKIVRLSVIGVEHNPESDHFKIEKLIEASGLKYAFVRPTFFDQNCDEGMLDGIKAGSIALPTGEGKTAFVDARDIGAVAAELISTSTWDGQGITVTGSEALTYGDMARILTEQTGVKVVFKDLTTDEFKAAWKSYGIPEHYVNFMAILYGAVKAGYTATVADGVKKVLGREPIKFAQYAKDYAAKFKA